MMIMNQELFSDWKSFFLTCIIFSVSYKTTNCDFSELILDVFTVYSAARGRQKKFVFRVGAVNESSQTSESSHFYEQEKMCNRTKMQRKISWEKKMMQAREEAGRGPTNRREPVDRRASTVSNASSTHSRLENGFIKINLK